MTGALVGRGLPVRSSLTHGGGRPGGGVAGQAAVRFQVLGPLQVDGDVDGAPTRPAQRRLLHALLVDAGTDVSRDVLIDRLWGLGAPASAVNTLQVHVSGLRKVLGPVVVTSPYGYRLDVAPEEVDAVAFEAAVEQAHAASREGDWPMVLAEADRALALWRGDPHQDVIDEPFAQPVVARLLSRRHDVALLRARALLECAQPAEAAAAALEHALGGGRHDERVWEVLMLARARAGRRADALQAFLDARTALDEVGLEPGPVLRRLQHRILSDDHMVQPATRPHAAASSAAPPDAATTIRPGGSGASLPRSVDTFLGRDDLLATVPRLVDEHGLVTLTGHPGVGKTRLAIEAGRRIQEAARRDVWFVRLAGARTEADVVATLVRTVGMRGQHQSLAGIADALATRATLLVLDNCEHVRDVVAALAARARRVHHGPHLLVTSRVRLGVAGERVVRVMPLPVGDGDGGGDGGAAVDLLVERLRELDAAPADDPATRARLVALCHQLEGIPLAIELAARRVPQLGLRDATRLLAAVRSSRTDDSVAAAIAWSYDLLVPTDRDVLDGIAVLDASFDLPTAVALDRHDGGEMAVAGALVRLADASLVTVEPAGSGGVRYRVPQPIRDVARERLAANGREEDARRRHATWFRRLATRIAAEARGPNEATAFATSDLVIADLRTAMRWFADHGDGDAVAEIAVGLTRWWYARFLGWEGRRWLQVATTAGLSDERPGTAWAAGFLAYAVHDYEAAEEHFGRTLALARTAGDRRAEGDALYGLGRVHLNRTHRDGRRLLEEAAERFSDLPDRQMELGECLLWQGLDEAFRRDPSAAVPLLRAAVGRLEAHGHVRQVSKALRWWAHAERRRGNAREADELVRRAEALAREVGDEPALAGALLERAIDDVHDGEVCVGADHALEALALVPSKAVLDQCAVLTAAVHVLGAAGDHRLALQVCGHIDAQFARWSRRPLDEEQEMAALRDRLRDRCPDAASAESEGAEMTPTVARSRVTAALRAVQGPQGPRTT